MRPLGRLPRVVGTSLSFSRQRRRGEEDAVVVVIEVDNSLTMNFIPPPTTTPLILLCDQPSRIGAQLVGGEPGERLPSQKEGCLFQMYIGINRR
jgi:hypothetical protein